MAKERGETRLSQSKQCSPLAQRGAESVGEALARALVQDQKQAKKLCARLVEAGGRREERQAALSKCEGVIAAEHYAAACGDMNVEELGSFLSDMTSPKETAAILSLLSSEARAKALLLLDVHTQSALLSLLPASMQPATLEQLPIADRWVCAHLPSGINAALVCVYYNPYESSVCTCTGMPTYCAQHEDTQYLSCVSRTVCEL